MHCVTVMLGEPVIQLVRQVCIESCRGPTQQSTFACTEGQEGLRREMKVTCALSLCPAKLDTNLAIYGRGTGCWVPMNRRGLDV